MVPEDLNEDEVLAIIEKIVNSLAYKYCFSHFDVDDIKQEGFIIGLEGLERYDRSQPLENFLWVHISNRLKSFKRDNYIRPVPSDILPGTPEYEEWEEKYATKKNLLEPISIKNVRDEHEKNMWTKIDFVDDLEISDIFSLIDKELPVNLREDFLKLKQGMSLPKPKRERVYECIVEILEQHGYE